MRWYHAYLDAGDQTYLAKVAASIMQEASSEIIVHSMVDGV